VTVWQYTSYRAPITRGLIGARSFLVKGAGMLAPIAMLAVLAGAGLFACGVFAAQAQQFSADLVYRKAGGAEAAGRLNVLDRKVRIQTPDLPAGHFIVHGDAAAAYFVRSAQRIFMDAKQSNPLTQLFVPVDPDDPCAQWQAMARGTGAADGDAHWRCERIGDDWLAQRRTIKYRAIAPGNRSYLAWIDPWLGFTIRLETEDGTSVAITNVVEVPQPDSLFEISAGYRKFDPQALIDRIKQSDVWVESPK
jgi:hypothetical protein